MPLNSNCIFCKIISGVARADILFQNEELIVFKDKKPASKYHFQVVPTNHILNINYIETAEDKMLVERMTEIGKRVLDENGGDIVEARLGFHVPPYNSVDHLHLHVISPVSEMSLYDQQIFQPHPQHFELVDHLLKRLSK